MSALALSRSSDKSNKNMEITAHAISTILNLEKTSFIIKINQRLVLKMAPDVSILFHYCVL